MTLHTLTQRVCLSVQWLAILVQTSGLLRCLPFPFLAGVVQTAVCLAAGAGAKAALRAATGLQDDVSHHVTVM